MPASSLLVVSGCAHKLDCPGPSITAHPHTNHFIHPIQDYTSWPAGTTNNRLANLQPNKHDFDQLVAIYSHKDATTSAVGRKLLKAATPANTTAGNSTNTVAVTDVDNDNVAGLDLTIDATPVTHNPKTWGKQLHKKGKHASFVKRTGKNSYVLTDVTMVDDSAPLLLPSA